MGAINGIQEFQMWHIAKLKLRAHERDLMPQSRLQNLVTFGTCVTIFADGAPLAILGFVPLWSGVYDVFVLPGENVKRFAKTFHKTVKHYMNSLCTALPVHRLQTYSIADSSTDKWMSSLGFECEGTLTAYTSDKLDYRIWRRLVGE